MKTLVSLVLANLANHLITLNGLYGECYQPIKADEIDKHWLIGDSLLVSVSSPWSLSIRQLVVGDRWIRRHNNLVGADGWEILVMMQGLLAAAQQERYADAIVYRDETETLPGWNDRCSQATHIDSRYGWKSGDIDRASGDSGCFPFGNKVRSMSVKINNFCIRCVWIDFFNLSKIVLDNFEFEYWSNR